MKMRVTMILMLLGCVPLVASAGVGSGKDCPKITEQMRVLKEEIAKIPYKMVMNRARRDMITVKWFRGWYDKSYNALRDKKKELEGKLVGLVNEKEKLCSSSP